MQQRTKQEPRSKNVKARGRNFPLARLIPGKGGPAKEVESVTPMMT